MPWSVRASLLFTMLVSGCASAPNPPEIAPAATAQLLVNSVSIVDPDTGTTSAPHDILIQDGRIAAIGAAGSLAVPRGTPRIDGAGRFAIPGLIDVHAHLGEGGLARGSEATRDRALRQFLRYGVTSIFAPGGGGASDAAWPALRQHCRSTVASCPGLYGSGSLITAPGSHPVSTIFDMPADVPAPAVEALGVTMLQPGTDLDALITAKRKAGADAIKIVVEDGPPPWYPKPRLSNEQIRAIIQAAHAQSLPVFSHVSTADHVRVAVAAGVDGIMHSPLDRLPDDLVRLMAERRTWYVPTFALYDGLLTWSRKQREPDAYAIKGVDPSVLESLAAAGFLNAAPQSEADALRYLANASDNLRRVAAAGVPVALGSDVNNPFVYPGHSAHEELSWMVLAGLTPVQALRAGTLGGASFLRNETRIGRIATGYEADLVLLARNPLERIENSRTIVAVIADGHLIPNVVSQD